MSRQFDLFARPSRVSHTTSVSIRMQPASSRSRGCDALHPARLRRARISVQSHSFEIAWAKKRTRPRRTRKIRAFPDIISIMDPEHTTSGRKRPLAARACRRGCPRTAAATRAKVFDRTVLNRRAYPGSWMFSRRTQCVSEPQPSESFERPSDESSRLEPMFLRVQLVRAKAWSETPAEEPGVPSDPPRPHRSGQ